jgi:predicted ester cyclase
MSAEENKVVVRRLIEEVYNRGNLAMADELLAPDYVDHTWPPGKYAGREGLKRSVAKQRAAFSDLHNNIEEQIAEGDKVVSWVISSGTHDRERFLGLASTGERMTRKHIFISRVVEGKIVEVWGVGDISDVWQQRLQRERIERERVEQELQVARRIQQASLPKEVPALEGWQISPYYQPAVLRGEHLRPGDRARRQGGDGEVRFMLALRQPQGVRGGPPWRPQERLLGDV